MANTFLTPEIIAKEALMILRNNAVMSNLVYRDYSNEFAGHVGDTITIRKPASFTAKEFSGTITPQNVNETGVPVTLNKHLDVSIAVTSAEMALDIEDFGEQVLKPAMTAFADKVDADLLALAKTTGSTNKVTQAAAIGKTDVISARKFLTKNAAPLTDRNFVYNTDAEADLLNTDLFISAEKVGDEGTALREASLGRKFGMNFFVDQNMDGVTDLKAIAFHKNGLALVTRPLEKPQGAAKSATVNFDGFGLRVVYGYDMNTKTDTVSIDMLYGVAALDKKLVSEIVAK